MYQVNVRRHFDAAHGLRGYEGKCENLHGHRWEVVASVATEGLDQIGMAVDFVELKRALDAILDRFDHHNLNETEPFDRLNPSSENIARVVYGDLKGRLLEACAANRSRPAARLQYVQAWESPDAWATYSE